MNVRRVGIFLLSTALLAPVFASAQISLYYTRPLTLTMAPENPAPGETVRLSISSYALDLDRSMVTWRVDGAVVAEGVGVRETSIAAGKAGDTTEVSVDVEGENGDLGHADARIAPSELDLLWTVDSYAPPFFKGKHLAGTGAAVEAYALARFSNGITGIPEKDIVYTWYVNDSVQTKVSGRGKSHALLDGPARGSETIRVVAESVDRLQRAEATATVTAYDAKLSLYENHPLFGILFHRAIVGTVNTIEQELKVTTAPYFARTNNPSNLSYEWNVNEVPITSDQASPETLVLTAKGYTGPADITVSAMNPNDILMRSLGAWHIIFGGSSNIFSANPLFGE